MKTTSGGLPLETAVRNCWASKSPLLFFTVTVGYFVLKAVIRDCATSSSPLKPITFSVPDGVESAELLSLPPESLLFPTPAQADRASVPATSTTGRRRCFIALLLTSTGATTGNVVSMPHFGLQEPYV